MTDTITWSPDYPAHEQRIRETAIEECISSVCSTMVAQEWPPQDGDAQIDEVVEALRNLVIRDKAPVASAASTIEDDLSHVHRLAARLGGRFVLNDPPVDPDLIAAREICAKDEDDIPFAAREYRAGERDKWATLRLTLAGIKHGRAMERGE